jgi:hypothetical protein
MKRLFRVSAILFFIVLLGAFITYLSIRNRIVEAAVKEKTERFNASHLVQISYQKTYLKGFKTLCIDSLALTSSPADTIVSSGRIKVNINLFKLIRGKLGIRSLTLENIFMSIDDSTLKNFDKLLSRKGTKKQTDTLSVNFQNKAETILERVFGSVPSTLILTNSKIKFSTDTSTISAAIGDFVLKRGNFKSSIIVSVNGSEQSLQLDGKLRPGRRLISLHVSTNEEGQRISAPLAKFFGVDLSYRSLDVSFLEISNKDDVSRLKGEFVISKSEVFHPSLSSKVVEFPGSSMDFSIAIGPNFVTLDSISEITLGELSLHPYVNYVRSSLHTLEVSFSVAEFTSREFFTSIPEALFSQLKNIDAEGKLSYRAKMFVDFSLPDSLKLESKLIADGFKIIRYDENLLKMKTPFIYTAYEKGVPKRQIFVGPGNPGFTSLGSIPKLLQTTVLFAENDAFFYDNGFSLEAIRYALAQDIKEKRFARGGSTISMQLIKNVYLSREKTFSRKLEEIILVWLIESNRLVSKARMYEVYLNIIEWGPNVYGASEAARFYFSKNVSQLNAAECIFLASVIPSPRKFYWRFDKEGTLAQFERDYFVQMSERLAKWGYIPSANADSLISELKITGPAKNYLKNNIAVVDSVNFSEDEE